MHDQGMVPSTWGASGAPKILLWHVVATKFVREPKKVAGVANMTNFIGPSWSVSCLTSVQVQTVIVLVSPTN